jgi:hypothetical protein
MGHGGPAPLSPASPLSLSFFPQPEARFLPQPSSHARGFPGPLAAARSAQPVRPSPFLSLPTGATGQLLPPSFSPLPLFSSGAQRPPKMPASFPSGPARRGLDPPPLSGRRSSPYSPHPKRAAFNPSAPPLRRRGRGPAPPVFHRPSAAHRPLRGSGVSPPHPARDHTSLPHIGRGSPANFTGNASTVSLRAAGIHSPTKHHRLL